MAQSPQQLRSVWANHIQQHHESGLTGKAYCEQNNLNYDQFGYWKKRIKDQSNQHAEQSRQAKFTPVTVTSPSASSGLSISLPNGVTVNGIAAHNQALTLSIVKALT